MIILQDLTATNHRKSGKSKYDRKLTELDVVTTRIRYCVHGVLSYLYGGGIRHNEDIMDSFQSFLLSHC